jgi:hypothetical protein
MAAKVQEDDLQSFTFRLSHEPGSHLIEAREWRRRLRQRRRLAPERADLADARSGRSLGIGGLQPRPHQSFERLGLAASGTVDLPYGLARSVFRLGTDGFTPSVFRLRAGPYWQTLAGHFSPCNAACEPIRGLGARRRTGRRAPPHEARPSLGLAPFPRLFASFGNPQTGDGSIGRFPDAQRASVERARCGGAYARGPREPRVRRWALLRRTR